MAILKCAELLQYYNMSLCFSPGVVETYLWGMTEVLEWRGRTSGGGVNVAVGGRALHPQVKGPVAA